MPDSSKASRGKGTSSAAFVPMLDAGSTQREKALSYLIAPFQHILLSLLHLVVDVEKLNDAVLSDVVSILLGFFPVQRRALRQQTHRTV